MRPALMVVLLLWPDAVAAEPSLDLVPVPAGILHQGDPEGDANEVERQVQVPAVALMRHEVTNAQFAKFVAETGYLTDPERRGFGYVWSDRWRRVPGADWRHPGGPETGLEGLDDHPVVQVSQQDAAAFCAHHGLMLPGEAAWERAARGDDRRRYPWGDQPPEEDGARRANFGTVACCAPDASDGFRATAPVGSFPNGASPFGLLDMAGNVWEWTADPFPGRPDQVSLRGGGWGNNPYCLRVSYRHGNPPNIGLDMVGFRCAQLAP
ncbi:MAG: SUMF1/EgtB/PvdO family nonheme iron enzyme [Pseudomonadota bacterium]